MDDSPRRRQPAFTPASGPVFAPDLDRAGAFLPDEGRGRQLLIFGLILLVLIAGGGGLAALYGGDRPTPVFAAPAEPYKVAVADAPVRADARAIDALIEGQGPIDLRPREEPAIDASPEPSAAAPPGPRRWLAQIAALRSEAAAREAWNRLSARDPALFANAALDLQRADLGPRGVYFRVRAGYFDDQRQAGAFCARVKSLGQECIVVGQ